MRQQINLYQPVFGEQRKPLSAGMFAMVLGAIIVGLVAYSVRGNMQLAELTQNVAALRVQQAEQEAQLAASGELLAARDKPAEIDARLRTLERTIAERRSALKILQSGAAGQALGFASRMEALARRHVDGLWIDKLVLSGTNGSMSLSGATLDADIVPIYLQNLARERVLSGTRFDEFVIERPAAKAVEPADVSKSDDSLPKKRTAAPQHIRFRAGSKSLLSSPDTTEAAT
jgi:Tfp pilus assembly protein PilN